MKDYEDDIEIGTAAARISMIWIGGIAIVLFAIAVVTAYTRPFFLAKETEAVQASPAYVKTKQDLLVKLMGDYWAVEARAAQFPDIAASCDAQQRAILMRMHSEAKTLTAEQIPAEVSEFLRSRK